MKVNFYTFAKRINSTKQPNGTGTEYDCILKDGCSVLSPEIKLDLGLANAPTAYNYAYIPTFGRYYYVRWRWEDRLWIGQCTVDPLASFKTGIGATNTYVVRSSSSYDLDIMDQMYPTKAELTESIEPLSGISGNIDNTGVSGTYVIGLKSKASNNGLAYYAMNETEFGSFCDFLYSDVWMDPNDLPVSIQKMLTDPFNYIVSCMWYPFTITGSSTPVYFGYFDWTGHSMQRINIANRLKSFLHSGTLPNHPQYARGHYLNASPYTRMVLDLYCFGKIALDPNYFLDSRSYSVNMAVDLFTGIGTCKVESTRGQVYKGSATVGVPVQLSQVKSDLSRPLIDTAVAAAALGAENYVGAAASITDVVKSAMPQISSIGSVGSNTSYAYNSPEISIQFYKIVDEDLADLGRPLCQVKTISSLSGFIKCNDADPSISCSDEELSSIVSYMNNGFFYE